MSTVINNPSGGEGSDNFFSTIIGVIIVIVLIVLFFVFVLPAIRNSDAPAQESTNETLEVNVKLPDVTPQADPEADPAE